MTPPRSDAEMVGQIALLTPSMRMIEIVVFSTLLDVALCEELDMEGGKTGRHGTFPPSELQKHEWELGK